MVSEWTAGATASDSRRLEWDGIDVFPFHRVSIARKHVYSTFASPGALSGAICPAQPCLRSQPSRRVHRDGPRVALSARSRASDRFAHERSRIERVGYRGFQ